MLFCTYHASYFHKDKKCESCNGVTLKKGYQNSLWWCIIKEITKDPKMFFLNFKKSKLGRHGTEKILHFLTCHQHGKDVNIGVKPSACYSSRHVPQIDTENRGHEKYIWHSYMMCVSKKNLYLGCQPSSSFPYLFSQTTENTLRWKK